MWEDFSTLFFCTWQMVDKVYSVVITRMKVWAFLTAWSVLCCASHNQQIQLRTNKTAPCQTEGWRFQLQKSLTNKTFDIWFSFHNIKFVLDKRHLRNLIPKQQDKMAVASSNFVNYHVASSHPILNIQISNYNFTVFQAQFGTSW